MTVPQIIIIALSFMGLGVSLSEHGTPRTGKHSFALTLAATAFQLAVLYWGGFFAGGAA